MSTIIDPLQPEAPAPRISSARVVRRPAQIVAQRDLNHDTVELVIACTPAASPIQARAGQFASLTFPEIGQTRAYSYARDPYTERPGEHTFYIRRVPGGAVSAWLSQDRRGAHLEVAGPLGRFVLDENTRPMLLVAGGSGLSAIKALVEEAARRAVPRDCLVLHGARTQADLYASAAFAELRSAWHPAHEFDFLQVLSDEPASNAWPGARELVTDTLDRMLGQRGAAAAASSAWLCGPPPMIAAAARVLEKHGVPANRIHRDLFTDLRSPPPHIDNGRCVLCDECLLVRPVQDCIIEANVRTTAGERDIAARKRFIPGEQAGLYYQALRIDEERCLRCYACLNACPHGAIRLPA